MDDFRPDHLGWVETWLRSRNEDLPNLRLYGQAHYTSSGFAFIVVFGVDHDRDRRRSIRSEASELLIRLGHAVELEQGRDIFILDPLRPRSAHEAISMLHALQGLLGPAGKDT
jgi:hypothetical protein